MEMYDLIIVGAGPIGMTIGIESEKRGLSYLIIDKGVLVNSLYHFPTNMTFFSTSKLLEIGETPFISHQDKPTRREALEYFRRVNDKWNLNINLYEKVLSVDGQENAFELTTDKAKYQCKNVVIATGFYDLPNKMNIPGEDLEKVKHYYDEPHPYIGQKVAVIGAANSACDVALELYHKGAEVTMIVRKPNINERVKYWIKPNIENRIKEGSIKAYFNARLTKITDVHIHIETEEGGLSLENDFVLAMTGYKPDYHLFKALNISLNEDVFNTPIYDEHTHESSNAGIYLAGVICGGLKTNAFFIENAKDHAVKITTAIAGKN